MASFTSYNTDNTGVALIGAGATLTLNPIESGVADTIAISCWSDQAGTLKVQQSFENPYIYTDTYGNQIIDPSGIVNLSNQHWDIAVSESISASTVNAGFSVAVLAPYLLFQYINSSGTPAHLRLFVRVFGDARD